MEQTGGGTMPAHAQLGFPVPVAHLGGSSLPIALVMGDLSWEVWGGAAGLALLLAALAYYWGRRSARREAARFESLMVEAPSAILLLNGSFRIVEANEAAAEWAGYAPDTRGRQHLRDFVTPAGAVEWEALPTELDSEGRVVFDAVLDGQEGEERLVEVALSAFMQEGERYVIASLNDITDRKEQSELFKDFHRQILQHVPIEVAVLSPNGQYIYANPTMAKGEQAQKWLKKKTDVDYAQKLGLHPEVALRRRSHRKRAISTGERVHFEEALSLPNGSSRHFDRYYAPIFDPDGEVYAVMSFGLETTALKEQRQEVEQIRAESEEFIRLRRTFLDNLRHEFRTPLTGIIGAAEVLQLEVDGELMDFIDIVEQNGRRLMSTLNALLDLAGIESRDIELNPEILNVAEEVESVVDDLRDAAEEKGLFLRPKVEDPEIFARLDRASFHRVLTSLIGNAVKFTEEGGVLVEVDETPQEVHVRVMDTGVGIQKEFLPNLFEEFRQESDGLTREYDGSGLGLTVVKRMIEMMNGTVSVDSEKEEGSTFTLSIPKAFQPRAEDQVRLLLAEEADDVRKIVVHHLEDHFVVDCAGDLGELEHYGEQGGYQAVLLNIDFGQSGDCEELLETVRALHGTREVPVLAIDTQGRTGRAEACLSVGYAGYLDEPFRKHALLNAVSNLYAEEQAPKRAPLPA